MNEISEKQAEALVRILALAENHPMWTKPFGYSQDFRDDTYEAIQTVRAFLKDNDIGTFYALLQSAAEAQAASGKEPQ